MTTKRRGKPRTQRKTMERLLIHAAILVLTGAVSGGDNLFSTRSSETFESPIDAAESDATERKQGLAWLQRGPSITEVLKVDHDRRIHDVVVQGISTSLEQMTGLERSNAVCTLATSPRVELRTVAALALECPQPVVGAAWCLEQLARDPAAIVRVVTARAAKSRLTESEDRFANLLDALKSDADPAVARAAQEIRPRRIT